MSNRLKWILILCLIPVICISIFILSIPLLYDKILKAELDILLKTYFKQPVTYSDIQISSTHDLPYMSVVINNFYIQDTVKNKADTSIFIKNLNISLSVKDWLIDKRYNVNKVLISQPVIKLRVFKNNSNNYSSMLLSADDSIAKVNDTAKYAFNIQKFMIMDAKLTYQDLKDKWQVTCHNLDFNSMAQITDKFQNIILQFDIEKLDIKNKKTYYIHAKPVSGKLDIKYDIANKILSINDHFLRIDKFSFGFEGALQFINNGFNAKLTFKTSETNLHSFVNLIPGIYKKNYTGLDVKGTFDLTGNLTGTYIPSQNIIPTYNLMVKLNDGFVKYEKLSQAIKNINLDMQIVGNSDKDKFQMYVHTITAVLDSNRIDGNFTMTGLNKPYVKANFNTKLELHELIHYLPLDSLELAGELSMAVQAEGVYDKDSNSFPKIDALVAYKNGYIKHMAFGHALEKVNVKAEFINNTGKWENSKMNFSDVSLLIDNEPFNFYGQIENFKDIKYNMYLKSTIDISKLNAYLPLHHSTLNGTLSIKLSAKGAVKSNTKPLINGDATINNFHFSDEDDDIDIKIKSGQIVFLPDMLIISKIQALYNDSPFALNASFMNYIPYFFDSTGRLSGNISLKIDTIDISKLIQKKQYTKDIRVANTVNKTKPQPTGFLQPFNKKDITLRLGCKYINFGKYNFTNIKTTLKVNENEINIKDTYFKTLDADIKLPTCVVNDTNVNVYIEVNNLDTRKLAALFANTDSAAKSMDSTGGILKLKYKIYSKLGKDFKPILPTITATGTINVDKLDIKGFKVLHHISKNSEHNDLHTQEIHDAVIETDIKDEIITINPFELKLGKYKVKVEGTHTFKNELNYHIRIGIPPFYKIKLPVHVTGTMQKPDIKISAKE
ncbi:MAG: AsmA-like C-terminal region-containing protein [Cytophagales bacterium]|nr:AsmA-like C-terminal region-containing protein [Cytophagales bacterium]